MNRIAIVEDDQGYRDTLFYLYKNNMNKNASTTKETPSSPGAWG